MPGATRTPDLQLRRLTLYPTELQAHTVNGHISLTKTDIICQGFCGNRIYSLLLECLERVIGYFSLKHPVSRIIAGHPRVGKVS